MMINFYRNVSNLILYVLVQNKILMEIMKVLRNEKTMITK